MKRILILTTFVLLVQNLFGQNISSLDRIILKDYSVIEANLIKVSEKEIEYTLPKETLINVLEISKVVKIVHKNGRVQEFNIKDEKDKKESSNNNSSETAEIKTNIIAVLPVPFLNKETSSSSSEMSKMAQNEVYNTLISKSSNISPLTVQDTRTTNSLLKKAGIDYTNIDETPIEDLHNILGVDNIISCKVNYIVIRQNTTTSSENTKIKGEKNKATVDDFSTSTSNENKKFEYNIYFDMYKNKTKIYSKNRQPFLKLSSSWIDAVNYLLKRSPIYIK